jgi:choline dehydrogenase-like flavoprotein
MIKKVGVVGAGTMGSGIAALLASAGVPVVLLDIPGKEDRNEWAKKGLERALKAKPAAFMDPDLARYVEIGNTEDDLEKLQGLRLGGGGHHREAGAQTGPLRPPRGPSSSPRPSSAPTPAASP